MVVMVGFWFVLWKITGGSGWEWTGDQTYFFDIEYLSGRENDSDVCSL